MSTAADKRVDAQRVKLTRAQAETLHVLVKVAEKPGGGRVEASKRMSTLEPRPNVNYLAAGSLARKGLARRIDADLERGYVLDHGFQRGIVCSDKYEVTAAGVAVWAERRR